jgi:hypothetical protein
MSDDNSGNTVILDQSADDPQGLITKQFLFADP